MISAMNWVLLSTGLLAVVFCFLLFRQGANVSHWWQAFGQVVFIWIISNAPIGLLLLESGLDPNSSSIFDLFNKQVRYTETIIYIAAILAPVLLTLIWNFRATARVYILINIAGVILCIGSASYIYARHLMNASVDTDALAGTTLTIYFLSLLFWYFSQVYELIVTNPMPGAGSAARAARIGDSLP